MKQILPITALILLFDQFTKYWSAATLQENPWTPLSWFQLTYSENSGIAFGIEFGGIILIVLSTILILLFGGYAFTMLDLKPLSVKIGVSLVLGGALGNLTDRIALGVVRDFIRFSFWPTFNVADAALLIGLLLILIHLYTPPHERRKSQPK